MNPRDTNTRAVAWLRSLPVETYVGNEVSVVSPFADKMFSLKDDAHDLCTTTGCNQYCGDYSHTVSISWTEADERHWLRYGRVAVKMRGAECTATCCAGSPT